MINTYEKITELEVVKKDILNLSTELKKISYAINKLMIDDAIINYDFVNVSTYAFNIIEEMIQTNIKSIDIEISKLEFHNRIVENKTEK